MPCICQAASGASQTNLPPACPWIAPAAVRTTGCTRPINQLHHRHVGDSSTAQITGLWLGAWQNHDNTADDEWGPGKGGAACQAKDGSGPMQWGKAFNTMSKKCAVGNALTTVSTATRPSAQRAGCTPPGAQRGCEQRLWARAGFAWGCS